MVGNGTEYDVVQLGNTIDRSLQKPVKNQLLLWSVNFMCWVYLALRDADFSGAPTTAVNLVLSP